MSDLDKLMNKLKKKEEPEEIKKAVEDEELPDEDLEEEDIEEEDDIEEEEEVKTPTPKEEEEKTPEEEVEPEHEVIADLSQEVALLQNDGLFRRELLLTLKDLVVVHKANTQNLKDLVVVHKANTQTLLDLKKLLSEDGEK